MARLGDDVAADLDALLSGVDARLRAAYPGERSGRQPVHTCYVPADRFTTGLAAAWGAAALAALRDHGPPPGTDPAVLSRVTAKLRREPVEELRIDFEDGYGRRSDAEEDAAARAAATALAAEPPPFSGIRVKSLEPDARARALRTIDVFLEALLAAAGRLPPGFVLTLPKVSAVEQVAALVLLCGHLERGYALPDRALRFEVQVETPQAVLGADGTATVAPLIHAAAGRLTGLHYGTYDYSAACGIAPAWQRLDHPAADHARAVMQAAAAGTGVRLSDGSCNVLPVGDTAAVHAAWELHAGLVRRSLERGYYQGWDLHPAQLPTRYAATYAFFRAGAPAAVDRLGGYLDRRETGVLDEPATARAIAGFLRRGLDCGALDPPEVPFTRESLDAL